MADLILNPLMQMVIDKLASPFLQKFQDRFNLKDNITKLQQTVPKVQDLLEDAQKQQETRLAVKNWLVELEDAAVESEVLLDELAAEMKARERRKTKGKAVAGLMFFPFSPSEHLFELASDLQHKLRKLDQIVDQGFSFSLREKAAENMSESSGRSSRETMSALEGNVYGREEEKQNIMNSLLHDNESKESPSVISIVGIGGVGKTALAQLVYKDDMVDHNFELKLWIHVSENFDLGKLMRSVIVSATNEKCDLCELDNLQTKLRHLLKGKRFLLVLDDVWNEDEMKWRVFINLFKVGAEGSRVLMTTRSQGIASITNSKMYELKGLAYDDCWSLFKEIAFRMGEDGVDNRRLVDIGKEIIRKCGGVPLAVIALANLLRFKKEEYWMSVQDSELWQFKAYQNAVMPALELSYRCLRSHLKRCLAFCSLFPKDHEIPREKMVYIWMAHGLISPDGGATQLEVIGGEYFDDLVSLSFFQEVQNHDDGCTTVYKMHDLIHDLVTTVGGRGFSVISHGLAPGDLERTHHLSMVGNFDPSSLPDGLFGAKHLRTLLLSPGGSSDQITPFWPVNFIHLKVLDLSGYGLKKVDEKVSELLCLRYLDLSRNPIQTLPRTICDLYFLQTLNLIDCQNLVELPFEMAKVTSLRQLNVKGCEALTRMPAMVGKLVQLQTMPIYIVGRRPGDSIAELEFLDLKNELSIKGLENIRDSEEAKKAKMREKKHLKCLKLQWGDSNGSKDSRPAIGTSSSNSSLGIHPREDEDVDVEIILKQLEPHSHLKNLHVKGYPGKNFPSWNLPNLTMVELINCRRCQNLPPLGHLPFLEKLHLEGMKSITAISQAFYGGAAEPFPSLKCLTIRDLPNLVEWFTISKGTPLPLLEELVLDKCPMLTSTPAFPSIRNLELHHCDAKIMESMETAASLSSLVIKEIPMLESLSGTLLKNNASLKSLQIQSCQDLLLLPSEIENLTSLKSLIITWCEKLKDLPPGLCKLKSLELLEINGCHSLKMLPYEGIEGLISLKTLSIENCSNLISFSGGFHHLTALEQLSIMSCPNLTSFPDGFHKLSSLRSLNIVSCPSLAYLPVSLQHATALQSLVIHWCPGLTALPEWFGRFSSLRSLAILSCENLISLPQGLECLTKLQLLSIQDCPILEENFKRKGIQWRRIQHIPHKYIGSMKL